MKQLNAGITLVGKNGVVRCGMQRGDPEGG